MYLNRLDQAWQSTSRRIGELTRYADDLLVLCASRERAEAALVMLRTLLAELGLELAAAKTRLVELRVGEEGFDFLGYHYRIMPTRQKRSRVYAAC